MKERMAVPIVVFPPQNIIGIAAFFSWLSVRRAFKRIKSTAIGVDGFPITFINWTLRHILPDVTHIFN
jgi:hypothetical protein